MIVTLPKKDSELQIQAWSGYDAIELLRTNQVTELILDDSKESDKVLEFLSINHDILAIPKIIGRTLILNKITPYISDED